MRLRVAAKKENRSLNNFVENALLDVVNQTPNKITLEALSEVKEGKYAGVINTNSMEAFIRSCE
jgi:hypothetical protein